MREHLSAAVIALSMGSPLGAGEIVLIGTPEAAGIYYYRVTVTADGSISADPVTQFAFPAVGASAAPARRDVPPPDAPPALPSPLQLSDLARQVRDLALGVEDDRRLATALQLAEIYSDMALAVAAGTIPDIDRLRRGTDAVYRAKIRRYQRENEWSAWKAAVDELMQPGDLQEAAEQWSDVAAGLRELRRAQ